jgi:hypothetical protein
MSALTAAQARVGTALERLEHALRIAPAAEGASETDLRTECERLRRELTAANERVERLSAALSEVESRVEGAIERVDELTGSRTAP